MPPTQTLEECNLIELAALLGDENSKPRSMVYRVSFLFSCGMDPERMERLILDYARKSGANEDYVRFRLHETVSSALWHSQK